MPMLLRALIIAIASVTATLFHFLMLRRRAARHVDLRWLTTKTKTRIGPMHFEIRSQTVRGEAVSCSPLGLLPTKLKQA